jgi:predicted component of type VI protein secretion system
VFFPSDRAAADCKMTSWILEITETDRDTREFTARDGLTIGSHIDNGIVLMDKRAAGHHAKLVAEEGGFAILDLGSDDGINVGQEQVLTEGQKQVLSADMELGIGQTRIVIRVGN